MLVAGLYGDARQVARTALKLVVLAAATAIGCWGLLSERGGTAEVAMVVTVLGGSALTLGFAAAPLVAGTVDPLDARRFAVFDIPAAPLAGALALAGVISVPVAAITALAVCAVVLWQALGVPWPLAALGAVLGVLTCALLARVCAALAALFLRERRSRELTGLFVLAILVVVVPVGVFLASLQWGGAVPQQLVQAARILGDSPLGAAWAIPARAADGPGALAACISIAVGTVVALAAGWAALVHHALHSVERPVVARGSGRLGWFAVTPGTPGGAIAARSLLYWLGDRRYLVNLLVIPLAGLFAMVPLLIVGVPVSTVVLLPVPIMALFLGWLPHNDLAYDSTAIWLHLASGVRGISDRIGRLVPVTVVGVPLLAVTVPIAIAVHGRWSLLPALVGVCASLFLCGLGLSSISSALAPYPVTRPGDSPFRQPERSGALPALAQALVLLGTLALSAPALGWGVLAFASDISYAPFALWGGLVVGLLVLAVGVAAGSAVFERRGPRLLEFAESA